MKDIRILNEPPYFEFVEGKDKVFNWIRKALLSSYDPKRDYGCHLKNIIGNNIEDRQSTINQIIIEVERIEEQLITRQLETQSPIPKLEQVKEIILTKIHKIDDQITTDIKAPFNGFVKKSKPLYIVSNEGVYKNMYLSPYHSLAVQEGDVFKKGALLATSSLGTLYNIGITFKVMTRDGEETEGELFPK